MAAQVGFFIMVITIKIWNYSVLSNISVICKNQNLSNILKTKGVWKTVNGELLYEHLGKKTKN